MLRMKHSRSRILLLATTAFVGIVLVGCGGEKPKTDTPGYYDGPMKGKGDAKTGDAKKTDAP